MPHRRQAFHPAPALPCDAFYRLTETDKPQPSDDEVLLSFATSSHLADMPGTPLPGPVCVEYVLRNGNRSAAFIRRERAHCGVEGDFPWSELVLVRNVKSLEVALYSTKTQFVEDWPSPLPPGTVPEAILKIATTAGTLSTCNAMFVFLLIMVVLLVGALSFFPALSLGPIAEHLGML